jgi:hypothetical protein
MAQQEPDQLRIARQLKKWTATGVIVAALVLVAATFYAYIAYRQLEQMRISAMVDQRPGIYPEETAWGFIGTKTKTAVVSVKFRNIGKTPAYKVNGWFCTKIRQLDPQDDSLDSEVCKNKNYGLIAPGIIFNVQRGDRNPVSNELRSRLVQNDLHLYFWGRVEYDDRFGQHHSTEFCMRSETAGRDLAEHQVGDQDRMGVCDSGNYAN